jgi:hypothetical protein
MNDEDESAPLFATADERRTGRAAAGGWGGAYPIIGFTIVNVVNGRLFEDHTIEYCDLDTPTMTTPAAVAATGPAGPSPP